MTDTRMSWIQKEVSNLQRDVGGIAYVFIVCDLRFCGVPGLLPTSH